MAHTAHPDGALEEGGIMRQCWDGQGKRCSQDATVRLIDPDGQPVPGAMCRQHAQECVDEYQEKLGENWQIVKLAEY